MVKLSTKINFILFPIISVIFIIAGIISYQSQKSLVLDSLKIKLEYESKLINETLENDYLELDSLMMQFLNSREVARYLNGTNTSFSAYTLENQLLRYISNITTSSGRVISFSLMDNIGENKFYFDMDDPFAEFKKNDVLDKHISDLNETLGSSSSTKLDITTYELKNVSKNIIKLSVYRTFSPEQSVYDTAFSESSTLYTAVISTEISIKDKFRAAVWSTFDKNAQLTIQSNKSVNNIKQEITSEITSGEFDVTGIMTKQPLLMTVITLDDSYIKSVIAPYKISIISLVINVTLISLLLLGVLIRKQIINPITLLSKQVQKTIDGDENALKLINRTDEVSSLNNNYVKLLSDINSLAKRDGLTGLANRTVFNASLNRTLEYSINESKKCALFYIDLDNFKSVNDAYGHQAGDLVLINFAKRLTECFRADDLVIKPSGYSDIARLAGDEFAVLLPDVSDIDTIAKIAERIVAICKGGFEVDGINHNIKISVGIAVYPNDASTAELLIKRADTAMYQVKRSGKGNYHCFSSELEEQILRHAYIESALKETLEAQEFYLVYMPIYDCRYGTIVGVEALLRSSNSTLKTIGPDEFIPVAESTGLIYDIDRWVLETAVKALKALSDDYGYQGNMAVNFSSLELKNQTFVKDVSRVIEQYEIEPGRLELELTETCLISSSKDVIERLTDLKGLGVQLSLDDFGTGYTAFNQLVSFPVDCLKIDRSFVSALDQNSSPAQRPLVDIIIELAALYELRVVAEGVETIDQLYYLRKLGCDMAQGYLMSKPIEFHELVTLLGDYKPNQLPCCVRDEQAFSFRTLSGSINLEVTDNILTVLYKGSVTGELIKYIINIMPIWMENIKSEHWGYLCVSEGVFDTSRDSDTLEQFAKLAKMSMESGCVQSAYVLNSVTVVKQVANFRKSLGLDEDFQDVLFENQRQAEVFLKEKLNELGNNV